MRSTEILAIALGLFASAAYSAPTGTINGRGPQTDTQPAENAVNDAVNKLRPASTLKSRGPQLDARAPQDPISDAINRLRPASGRRSAQGPGAAFESIENALNPSSRKVRSPQAPGGRIEDDGNNNLIRPNPPSRRSAQGPGAAFESIENALNPSSRRSAQGPGAAFESIENALNPSGRQVRSPQRQGRVEDDGGNNNLPQANPPSRRSAQGPGAAFESIENALNPSGRRSAQGENGNENGIRPNVPQAQGPPSLKTRSPQTASNRNGPGQASSSDDDSS
ncbi:hypothetical protein HBH56_181550 [Parastagonospora nodorum]|uniref:Uncharacterized protein n=1 Tax=Phaeosphaeria nodorum (strain SN15 / ATCC MYA-4574 / FGSC 10173) TaxID=321614 RepID=A0A7U2I746_PHANO|nr:hypothetical protein HBH56_181550 [Parastagonospora nodorum]QRD04264.1 hypothetical protein JI435_129970 [Parastagonospora nodorum SN15]KAH3926065.1 hypothetical protein HBH54_170700 [Parastagonospora nodorum]KAH4046924.1 hypothetical protein HBH49_174970 [Parastagonospora nodorum]KAH4133722.1 hypothetical protein HBH45_174420 [Parastagonospora nodorum]